jgi:predicted nuclease with TOPRIM domain
MKTGDMMEDVSIGEAVIRRSYEDRIAEMDDAYRDVMLDLGDTWSELHELRSQEGRLASEVELLNDRVSYLERRLSEEKEQVRRLVLEGAKNRDTIRRLIA